MKKTTVFAALLAMFAFSSCSDGNQDTAESTDDHAHHDGMAHGDNMPATGTVVVETPTFSSVAEPMKRNLAQLLDEYIVLKDALVESNAAAAKEAANAVLTSANAMPVATIMEPDQKDYAEQQIDAVRNSSARIAGTNDLAEQRNSLEDLSEAVFSLTKAFGATDKKVFYQHCPMVNKNQGAYWVSTNPEIRNPYFGSSMLKCGSNEEVLNSDQ